MRQIQHAIAVLQSNPLFRGFSAEEVAALLEDAPEPARFARGETVLGSGTAVKTLGFLLKGRAVVTRPGDVGARVTMSRLAPGAAFGMATLFGGGEAFPNEIRAETACTALFLPQEWAENLVRREARFALNYIALLSERILFLNRRIDAFTAGDVPRRLRGVLEDFRKRQGGGAEFTLPCSYTQLAALVDVSRASLYRALEQMEAEGIFAREGRVFRFAEGAFHKEKKTTGGFEEEC